MKEGILGPIYEKGDVEYELGIFSGISTTEVLRILATHIVEIEKQLAELKGD